MMLNLCVEKVLYNIVTSTAISNARNRPSADDDDDIDDRDAVATMTTANSSSGVYQMELTHPHNGLNGK